MCVGATEPEVVDANKALVLGPGANSRGNFQMIFVERDSVIRFFEVGIGQDEALLEHE